VSRVRGTHGLCTSAGAEGANTPWPILRCNSAMACMLSCAWHATTRAACADGKLPLAMRLRGGRRMRPGAGSAIRHTKKRKQVGCIRVAGR